MAKLNDGEAVLAGCLAIILVVVISLGFMALAGLVLAYCWNTFLVPNVEAQLPLLTWWQGAIGFLGLRMLFRLFRSSK